jgi:hypothetical protein
MEVPYVVSNLISFCQGTKMNIKIYLNMLVEELFKLMEVNKT